MNTPRKAIESADFVTLIARICTDVDGIAVHFLDVPQVRFRS